MKKINQYIDHTLLKAIATEEEIVTLCKEARENNFYSVCVNGCYVPLATKNLKDSGIKVCAVIGFPLGAMASEVKIFEVKQAVKDGAEEVDMVMNLGKLKSRDLQQIEDEIRQIKEILGEKILKVIIETCYLTPDEIVIASELAIKAKADFVKTSTGFGTDGANLHNIALIKGAIKNTARIKASGGIRNLDTALSFIEAGVDRIGTSSGVSIVKELER